MRSLSLVLCVLGGCLDSSSVTCGDGRVCPGGTTCVTAIEPDQTSWTYCVEGPQLDACDGQPADRRCSTAEIPDGRCYGGACIAIGCGNSRTDGVDPTDPTDLTGEICDDGNQVPGDGCSSDCTSIETCGNGTTDLVMNELCDDGNLVSHDGCTSDCQPEGAHWSRVSAGTPGNRTGTAMAYDGARHQMVLFGGYDSATLSPVGDTWIWDGVGWTQLDLVVTPGLRSGHSMAFDAARGRVVLFGGSGLDNTSLIDTWEWDGIRWTRIPTLTNPPSRSGQAMAYDPKRKLVVMFGGVARASNSEGPPDLKDTWLFDGANWTEQDTGQWPNAAAPVDTDNGRDGASMAFDPVRGAIVLFGGASRYAGTSVAYDSTVWELDASGWHPRNITSTKPAGRELSALAYDPIGQRMLLVGGQTLGTETGDEWALSASGWTPLSPSVAPEARYGHVMATDSTRRRVVLFGGFPITYSMWEWDGLTSKWSTPSSTVPPTGSWAGTYDTLRGRAVLVASTDQTFELDDTSWSLLAATPPQPYRVPSLAFDPVRKRTVMFDINPSNVGFTALFDGNVWSTASPATPTPNLYQGVIAPDANDDIVLFGGFDLGVADIKNDTWTWNGTTWTQRDPVHRPPARITHAMAFDPIRKVTVMLGGASLTEAFDDTWLWDGTDWTEVTVPGPTARANPSLAWHAARGRLVLFGGAETNTSLNDTWEFDGAVWSPVSAGAAPPARSGAVLLPEPDRGGMILFSGVDPNGTELDDTWVLRWDSADRTEDRCSDAADLDRDGLAGCADPDCFYLCAPTCTPGPDLATCKMTAPRCGDGTCNTDLETCRLCPMDCGACPALCGDTFCDPGETAASCPGDCP